jgi:hypothetical protein
VPGAACTAKRTCKIRVGTGNDITCCCGCSPGAGPIGCSYGAVSVGTTLAPAVEQCNVPALTSAASKAAGKADAKLAKADEACQAEKRADTKANAAEAQLTRLGKKVDKLAKKGQITAECAGALHGLIGELTDDIHAVETGGGGGGGTTTTTLPAGPSCTAAFTTYDPNEVDFVLSCTGGGLYDGFTLQLNGGRAVTNWLEPPGFTCSPTQTVSPADSLQCSGPPVAKAPLAGGRIHTVPAPGSDLDATLFVFQNGQQLGPFPTSGP